MSVHEDVIATHSSFRRFVTAGNAGGLIATLSLIGTTIGSSETQPSVSLPTFLTLLVFVVGLVLCGYALWTENVARLAAAELKRLRAATKSAASSEQLTEAVNSCQTNTTHSFRASLLAGTLLLAGMLSGILVIYSNYVI